MSTVLHIDGSPRDARSRSRPVATAFTDILSVGHQLTTLNLWEADLPSLGDGMIEGRYDLIMGHDVPPELAAAWAKVEQVAEHFLAHDMIIISAPMWNFGLPYRLKHYIDTITHPGMTFRNDASGNVDGLAAGKTAILILASAMPITADGPLAEFDFQGRYLEKWLNFIGITDIHSLRVAPTYGPDDVVGQVVDRACDDACKLATQLVSGALQSALRK